MIYGTNRLASGIVAGNAAEIEPQLTRHDPPLVTKVLARHAGNIVNIAQTTFEPGELRDDHVNSDVDEVLLALTGVIHVTSGAETVVLDAALGGFVYIPYGAPQAEENRGDQPAVLLSIAIRNENFTHLNNQISD